MNLRLIEAIRAWVDKTNPLEQVGGILLGRLEHRQHRNVVVVESCEPMHISHSFGPAFALNDGEHAKLFGRFFEPRTDGMTAVGFIRSDMSTQPVLTADDRQMLRSATPEAIFILIQPGPDFAAAFFCAGDRQQLAVRRPAAQELPARVSSPVFESWTAPQWTAALAACLILALSGAGYFFQQARTAKTAADLNLNVKQSGKQLRLTWNPRALHGRTVLWVHDGTFERSLQLTSAEIAHGSALYVPVSADVNFRMEVPGAVNSIWLIPSAAPLAPEKADRPKPASLPRRKPELKLVVERVVPKPARVRVSKLEPSFDDTEQILAPIRKKAPEVKRPVEVAPPKPAPIVARVLEPAAPVSSPAATFVRVSYSASPAEGTARRGLPVLRLFKHPRAVEPARPIGDLQPRVPESIARHLPLQTIVTVEASVDKRGRVVGVQPLTADANEQLVRLVTESVSRASFYPAQSNGRDVNSKLVLSFRFTNQPVTTASRAEVR